MTLPEFNSILNQTQYPVAYRHFEVENAPVMPFLCYAFVDSDNYAADGKSYVPIDNLEVQLFTKKKDITAETKVETVLDNNSLFWKKQEEYDEKELCYRIIYSVQTL